MPQTNGKGRYDSIGERRDSPYQHISTLRANLQLSGQRREKHRMLGREKRAEHSAEERW